MIRNADLALYAAKAAGRGKHCFYEAAMHSEATDRQRARKRPSPGARAAGNVRRLSADRPRRRARRSRGFEALVRWNHPARGPISPDKFIGLAEECGMIGKIGEFVLRTAVAEAAHWPEHVRIAVNLSPIQFNDPHIVDTIAAVLSDYRASSRRGSSWRLPKACSWPTAMRPTAPSPG